MTDPVDRMHPFVPYCYNSNSEKKQWIDDYGRVRTIGDISAQTYLDIYLTEKLNAVTLDGIPTPGNNYIDFVSGHGFVTGNYIEIWDSTTGGYFQTRVSSVSTDRVYIDALVDKTYGYGTYYAYRCNIALNVDGSVTPRIFSFYPRIDTWDIDTLIGIMTHSADADYGKFGGIAALTNGLFTRISSDAIPPYYPYGLITNGYNIKNNGDLAQRSFTTEFTQKAPSSTYGTIWRKSFLDNSSVIRMQSLYGVRLEVYVRDDLTALSLFNISIQGKRTEPLSSEIFGS